MIRFGICTSLAHAAVVREAGWDFVEENVQTLFQGTEPDGNYHGLEQVKACPLPVAAANCMVPGSLKITGLAVDGSGLKQYMTRVLQRAGAAGCTTIVFGSGGARQVPGGWDKALATNQIVEFGRMIAPMAEAQGVTIVLEHLNLKECNIVNTLAEELEIMQRVDHPSFRCLLDTYHLWIDSLPLSQLEPILPYLKHVHLADKDGRVAPGQSGTSDYRPVFAMLKQSGYSGGLSVEAANFGDIAGVGPKVLAFLREQWNEA